ncbi:MAG: PRC-barrel domain-containing protein [Actinomycetota bacterium]|nr:PRC-barrel domain-containing protein [Actinomycetota bacterium]
MDAMSQVREGMRVVDSTGEEIGTVEDLKMGDPEAVTSAGQDAQAGASGLMVDLAEGAGAREPDVPPQQAERMLRMGYVKIDGKGLFGSDYYAVADQVARVEGDTVHLAVPRDSLSG